MDADFALKLSTAKSNSFSVVADFFAKGIFVSEAEKAGAELQKKNLEKVRGPASIHSVLGKQSQNCYIFHLILLPISLLHNALGI